MSVLFIIYLFVVEGKACSKHFVLSLICAIKDSISFLEYFYSSAIRLRLLELLPSISVIDWFQQSSFDWSLSFVYLRSHFEAQKQSCFHSTSLAEAVVCFNVALHLKDFFCFSPFKTKSLVIQGIPTGKALLMHKHYLLNYPLSLYTFH